MFAIHLPPEEVGVFLLIYDKVNFINKKFDFQVIFIILKLEIIICYTKNK